MPAIPAAALPRTASETELIPATSTTEYSRVASTSPTYGFTSPLAPGQRRADPRPGGAAQARGPGHLRGRPAHRRHLDRQDLAGPRTTPGHADRGPRRDRACDSPASVAA